MDYEKEYKESLERARQIHDGNPSSGTAMVVCEQIFPELAESRDERIRRFLIKLVNDGLTSFPDSLTRSDVLDYLEKQKESTWTEEDESFRKHILPRILDPKEWTMEQIDADRKRLEEFVERQKNKWVEKQKAPNARQRLAEWSKTEEGKAKYEEVAKEMREEMEKEQKPAEWSEDEKEYVRTLKSLISDFLRGKEEVDRSYYQKIYDWLDGKHKEQKPAEWSKQSIIDALTKWLTEKIAPLHKKSLDGTITEREEMFMAALLEIRSFVNSPDFQIGKDTSAEWSEEDENMRNLIVAIFEVNHPDGFFKANELGTTDMRGVHTKEIISWLQSLPLNLKKKNDDVAKLCSNEWSEEEYGRLFDIEHYLDGTLQLSPDRKIACIDFLKSLRPSWKPSEEQMKALKEVAYNIVGTGTATDVHLVQLYEQLKKLM